MRGLKIQGGHFTRCNMLNVIGYVNLDFRDYLRHAFFWLFLPMPQLNKAEVAVNAGTSQTHNGVRFMPSQEEVPVSIDNLSVDAGPLQSGSGVKHRQNKKEDNPRLYPGVLARIEMDGYIRSQRVVSLALYPVQYSPTRRVNFALITTSQSLFLFKRSYRRVR